MFGAWINIYLPTCRPERNSIGDEIKDHLDSTDAGKRPSPLCEKAAKQNVSRTLNLSPAVPMKPTDGAKDNHHANVETSSTQTDDHECDGEKATLWSIPIWDIGPLALTIALMLSLLVFTFLGALETEDGRTFYPWTWVPELGLPEPAVAFGAQRRPNVW